MMTCERIWTNSGTEGTAKSSRNPVPRGLRGGSQGEGEKMLP
jgi:hypothetical protein